METEENRSTTGVGGVIKFIAVATIFLLAGYAVLVVLDVVPRDMLGETATKILLVGGISVIAVVAMALVLGLKSGK